MTRLRLYLAYRRSGLRRAWSLAGMNRIAWRAASGVAVGVAVAAAAALLSSQAQAIQDAADNRVAAKLASQAATIADQDALIANLSKFLAACLGPREAVIWVGDEAHFCKAVPTGIKR